MIMKAAWSLSRESIRDLLDVSLPAEDIEWITGFVAEHWPDVRSLHHMRTRKAGPYRFIDFHLVVDDRMSVGESHALGDEIIVAIKERLPRVQVQIHVEPCDIVQPDVWSSRQSGRSGKRPRLWYATERLKKTSGARRDDKVLIPQPGPRGIGTI